MRGRIVWLWRSYPRAMVGTSSCLPGSGGTYWTGGTTGEGRGDKGEGKGRDASAEIC